MTSPSSAAPLPEPTPPATPGAESGKTCPVCRSAVPADAPGGTCPRCLLGAAFPTGGAPAPDVPVAEVEARFPGYAVVELLGRGGMGVVFRARQRALDRDVAVKILPGAPYARPRGPDFAERFLREAKTLARLQHPGIVQVFDVATSADGWCLLAMELVDGANLRRILSQRRMLPREALAIVPQICDALQYAHDQGVVHRDIKPENVLLSRDGRVKIADFGLAKLVADPATDLSGGWRGSPLTASGSVLGTPHYMAPEQVERPGDVDHRADIYSLGVVFYEMLTGELPLGRFPAPSARADVDARIDEIVLRTLEKERTARFQNASEVRTSIEERRPGDPTALRELPACTSVAGTPPAVPGIAAATLAAGVGAPVVVWAAWAIAGAAGSTGALRSHVVWIWTWIAASAVLALAAVAWVRTRGGTSSGRDRALVALGLLLGLSLAFSVGTTLVRADAEVRRLDPYVRGAADLPGAGTADAGPVLPIVLDGVEVPATVAPGDAESWVNERIHAPAVEALAGRLQAMWPLPADSSFLDELYLRDDARYLALLDSQELLRKGAAGTLGLPFASAEVLGADLPAMRPALVTIEPSRTRGILRLADRIGLLVEAPVVRERVGPLEESPWRFAMRPIRRSR